MLLTQHMIVGSAVAVWTGNPYLGFLGAIVSHQVLDLLPHADGIVVKTQDGKLVYDKGGWTPKEFRLAYTDASIAAATVVIVILITQNWLVLIGAFGGALTDFLDIVPWWYKRFRATKIGGLWHKIHSTLHFRFKEMTIGKVIAVAIFQFFVTIGGIWASLKI